MKGDLSEYAKKLIAGELLIVPTETVYGLAANALDSKAVNKIFIAKGRPQDNPLIVHVENEDKIFRYTKDQPNYLKDLISEFSPGPLTYVLKKSEDIPVIVSAGLQTVAIRIPNNNILLNLIKISKIPIAAPSANRSGRPSSTNYQDAIQEFQNSQFVTGGIDGGNCEIGIESTVIKCGRNEIKILRPGKITKKDIEEVVDVKIIEENESNSIESPGTKYKHYSPEVKVHLVQEFQYLKEEDFIFAETDSEKYFSLNNSNLYDLFRLGERQNKEIAILDSKILRENRALYDRVRRASS